ncbi:hypothetical protein FHT26_004653 [Rhizobacter sp. SG703]|nr:hypothetical protein [Rhizobacter sp. SG703]
MAGPGGPDDGTWKRMTPTAKRVYWIFIAVVFGCIAYIWLK